MDWGLIEEIEVEEGDIFIEKGDHGPIIELSMALKRRLHMVSYVKNMTKFAVKVNGSRLEII